MENVFFKAAQLKLRFNINGSIATEDLFTVDYTLLSDFEQTLTTQVEGFGKSRRGAKNITVAQEQTKLRLEVVTAILDYRDAEKERINNEKETKEHNQKILSLIAQKQEESLSNLSIDELRKLVK
jgi:hypothetical protein